MKELLDTGCCGRLRKNQQGVKLLGDGADTFKSKIDIEVSKVSTKALQAIQRNGGTIKLVYYDREGLRSILKPHKFTEMPYLKPPPAKSNRKLRKPQEQPDQHPEFHSRKEQFLQQLKAQQPASENLTVPTSEM